MGSPASDQMLDFALSAVVVNSVTLLPFLPLDGGRLLDLADFAPVASASNYWTRCRGLSLLRAHSFRRGIVCGCSWPADVGRHSLSKTEK